MQRPINFWTLFSGIRSMNNGILIENGTLIPMIPVWPVVENGSALVRDGMIQEKNRGKGP